MSHTIDMEHIETPTPRLQEHYIELAEQLYRPYLSEQRKATISRELARIGFELDQRENEKALTDAQG